MVILAVVSHSLSKAHHKDTKYTPKTKKKLNFIDDIVKGTIFLLMVITLGGFYSQNSNKGAIIVAFISFLISMILFKIIHVIKWYVYCIGNGSDNLNPWTR